MHISFSTKSLSLCFLSYYLFRGELLSMQALIQEHPASDSCHTNIYTSVAQYNPVLNSLEPLECRVHCCSHLLSCDRLGRVIFSIAYLNFKYTVQSVRFLDSDTFCCFASRLTVGFQIKQWLRLKHWLFFTFKRNLSTQSSRSPHILVHDDYWLW